MSDDRAVEAVAEALQGHVELDHEHLLPNLARIAVEAAAPHIYEANLDYREQAALDRAERAEEQSKHWLALWEMDKKRVERAEAEVERLRAALREARPAEWYGQHPVLEESCHHRGIAAASEMQSDFWRSRAERAEGHVQQLMDDILEWQEEHAKETALADEMAEALELASRWNDVQRDALAKWRGARREAEPPTPPST